MLYTVYFSISLAKNIVSYTEDFLILYICLGVYTISFDDGNSLTSPIYYHNNCIGFQMKV